MAKKLVPQQRTRKIAEDQVTHLPEIGPVGNVQFAGYASVYPRKKQPKNPANEEGIFYWFVGAENYDKKPTILWSNGGPGSSSFWGFFIENGPYCFKENQDGKFELKPNPHS